MTTIYTTVCHNGMTGKALFFSGEVVAEKLSNSSLLAQQLPRAQFRMWPLEAPSSLCVTSSQSLIMAELKLQHEVEPEVLNGDIENEEREDTDPSESAKKKRRKKKKNKAIAPGKTHDNAS